MAISFACAKCGKKLKAPDNAAGKTSKCPGCGSPVTCPEPVYDAEPIEAPPGGLDPYGDIDTEQPYAMVPETAAPPSAEARRPCPMCGEMIVATAAKCRFCGEIFDPALKKVKKKGKRSRAEDEDLTTSEIVIAVLCSGIGCIAGLVWMIQGKPKGAKMLGISVLMGVFWSVVRVVLQSVTEQGGP